jgi:tetratricopeptide (TPR) repeat protein
VPERDFHLYREVIAEAYRFHDTLLGRLFELAGEETTIILCSDHGYLNDHLRPPFTPDVASGATRWHRQFGIFAMRGPGVLQDERVYGASLLDIAPTILHLLGLPVGADMDGRVLAQAFVEPPQSIPTIPSWDQIPGESGEHPPEARLAVWDSATAFDQLVALGYVAPRSETVEVDVQKAVQENQYNLAVSLMDGGRIAAAVPVLERLYQDAPENLLYGLHLSSAYQRVGRVQDARRAAEAVIARSQNESGKGFGRPRTSQEFSNAHEGPRIVPHVELLLGMLDLDEGNPEAAMEHLERAQQSGNAPPDTYTVIGQTWARMRRWPQALGAFQQAVAINPDDPRAHTGMAEALLGLRRNREAAEHAMDAIGLRFHLPAAHLLLGVALFRLRELDGSRKAFERCVHQSRNGVPIAARWLRRLERIEAQAAVR